MSFYHGDSRPDETIPSAHHALSPVEIGVIVGTVTAFFALVITIFLYRNHKAQRLQARQLQDTELGEFPQDHKDNPPSCDGEPLEHVPTAPKPVKRAGILSVSQLFYKPRLSRKTPGALLTPPSGLAPALAIEDADPRFPASSARKADYTISN